MRRTRSKVTRVGRVLLITDPANSANNPDNPKHPAGTTFFGQFLDHDFTFDLESSLGIRTDPEESPNGRTPMLDLDTVYGGGPSRSPQLYVRANRRVGPKLRIESGGLFEDVPRTRNGVAIIGDPRNDENMVISGLQAAFIKFHNNVVDLVTKQNPRDDADEIFSKARRIVTWHYQWIIVNEFLPLLIGQTRVNRLLERGPRFFRTSVPFIPVEFQGAAYRLGHSMVRPSYRANFDGDVGGNPATGAPAFFGMIFDPAGEGQADPVDLRGFTRAPRRFIGWQTFFEFDAVNVRRTKLLDTTISSPLFDLPLATIPGQTAGSHVFAAAQPAAAPHVVAAFRASDRERNWRGSAYGRYAGRPVGYSATRGKARSVDTAVVLHPERSVRAAERGATGRCR